MRTSLIVFAVLLSLLSYTFGGIAVLADSIPLGYRILFLCLQAISGVVTVLVLLAILDDIDSGR